MNPRAWSASAFDVGTLPEADRRSGLYSRDTVSARRDPSGVRLEHNVVKYKYPADHDIVYVTTPTPVTTGVNPPVLPEAEPPVVQTFRGQPTAFGRSQYVRRGQRCGDIGWGCYTVSPMESDRNGLRDGHAAVVMDLHKKHQFMDLPGDTRFEKLVGGHFSRNPNGRPQQR
uniref:Uncharacterized protein n=1 Tax=Chrysotila carterae TaxID=13221 RepID=A0A7S4F9M8_CHRCT